MRIADVITFSLVAAALLAAAGLLPSFSEPARAEFAEVKFGPRVVKAEVAATPRSREVGLMNRPSLPAEQGMLFVFPTEGQYCMWMKDTLIPLSVAFMDRQGRILNIADMQPGSRQTHCAAGSIRYALEVNQGWFKRRAIQTGDVASGIESLTAR